MSTGGKKYARVSGEMKETLACNNQLCRLPIWPGLTDEQVGDVVALVFEAFHERATENELQKQISSKYVS
jgi:dTDP-4-amino-4,6-dideoxygalactose transaminase